MKGSKVSDYLRQLQADRGAAPNDFAWNERQNQMIEAERKRDGIAPPEVGIQAGGDRAARIASRAAEIELSGVSAQAALEQAIGEIAAENSFRTLRTGARSGSRGGRSKRRKSKKSGSVYEGDSYSPRDAKLHEKSPTRTAAFLVGSRRDRVLIDDFLKYYQSLYRPDFPGLTILGGTVAIQQEMYAKGEALRRQKSPTKRVGKPTVFGAEQIDKSWRVQQRTRDDVESLKDTHSELHGGHVIEEAVQIYLYHRSLAALYKAVQQPSDYWAPTTAAEFSAVSAWAKKVTIEIMKSRFKYLSISKNRTSPTLEAEYLGLQRRLESGGDPLIDTIVDSEPRSF